MPNTTPIPRAAPSCAAFLLLAGVLLGACGQTAGIAPTPTPTGESESLPGLPQFNDVLVPAGAKLYVERTMIFGDSPWYGQLALSVSTDPHAVFEQYRRDMPNLGWQEVTSIRAPTSVVTFSRDDRVATVQIQAARIYGSEILIAVSPRGGSAGGGSPSASPRGPAGGGSLRPQPVQRGQ